ncbi:hypothetical protein EAX61_14445 [Dokdonia sinensis]|uniref:Uncharacterized protein n=1 Tax=Dokdonia sinensis TaxID=2479847 RepID=A0A3M0G3E2_9FLAO|nr:hypothetical protein [Dokdonia sinensis]RMB56433.1 hypothetical protein EAX61_14445 [Dokdonia sinensis]
MADESENRKKQLKDVALAIEEQIAIDTDNRLKEESTIFEPRISDAEWHKIKIGLAQANEGLGISREEARKVYERFL